MRNLIKVLITGRKYTRLLAKSKKRTINIKTRLDTDSIQTYALIIVFLCLHALFHT